MDKQTKRFVLYPLLIGAFLVQGPHIKELWAQSSRDDVTKTERHINSRDTLEREAEQYPPDSTGRNVRDRTDRQLTADDQPMSGTDQEVLAEIRRDITANQNLSTYGKNVKIIVDNKTVTLRGPVRTPEEKSWIEVAAAQAAPNYKVINELEIAPKGRG